jgi:hypothetical protein
VFPYLRPTVGVDHLNGEVAVKAATFFGGPYDGASFTAAQLNRSARLVNRTSAEGELLLFAILPRPQLRESLEQTGEPLSQFELRRLIAAGGAEYPYRRVLTFSPSGENTGAEFHYDPGFDPAEGENPLAALPPPFPPI